MNLPTRPHPDHVPTLTEVIELDPGLDDPQGSPSAFDLAPMPLMQPAPIMDSPLAPMVAVPEPVVPLPEPIPEPVPEVSEAQLTQRVLTDVQRQIDSMLEFRLRESMQPLLAQFIETLMQDLRDELSRTMRDVVTRAVAQEMAKLRNNNR
jgi:hypothetical protein